MVSLDNTKNLKGGFSFESVTPTINEDFIDLEANTSAAANDLNNDLVPLTSTNEPNFKKIETTLAIILQILTLVLLEVGVFLLPKYCDAKGENCAGISGFDFAIYIHSGFWLIKLFFDRYYHYHHMKSRRYGYLEFYRNTRLIRSLPLYIISAGNSALVIIVKVLEKYCPVKCTAENLTPENFLQIFVSFEVVLLFPILLYFLKQTITFNKEQKSPDISKELDRPLFLPSQLKDIGFKDSSYISNILENQADMIRYLQERNELLSKKLYQMNEKQANISNVTNIN